MKRIFLFIALLPLFAIAQLSKTDEKTNEQYSGISFKEGLTWDEIKVRARSENKYIFVDCYATWCKPCKIMDKQVYSNDTVGEFVNNNYISVKVQMDSNKNDGNNTKLLYSTARMFERDYKIKALPTYLIFSPDGNIVHKSMGMKNVEVFLKLMQESLDPKFQVFTLFENFKLGNLRYSEMPSAIQKLFSIKENDLGLAIARSYMLDSLEKLPLNLFATKENFDFIGRYLGMVRVTDLFFKLLVSKEREIDSMMNWDGCSIQFAASIIYNQHVLPVFLNTKNGGTDKFWESLEHGLVRLYRKDQVALTILNAQLGWYRVKKQTRNKEQMIRFIKSQQEKVELIGFRKVAYMTLNKVAWSIFMYSTDMVQMECALSWIDYVISVDKNSQTDFFLGLYTDTKANLLYKLGRVSEAITLEEKVVKANSSFQDCLNKMKSGIPTWSVEGSK